MIRIEGLTKHYGPTHAVKGLSFEVPKGQVVGFLGPNGAGKSTTMRILAGSLNPSGGRAFVGDIDVTENPVAARKLIGYLPESNPLYEEMMVIDYLRFVADVRDVPKDLRGRRIRSAAERCGLMGVISKDISQLSRGYRQRVGLAAAILHEPDLLFLDEPTAGLDPMSSAAIDELILNLKSLLGLTVVMVTHDLDLLWRVADRVAVLGDGRVLGMGTMAELSRSEEPAVKQYFHGPRGREAAAKHAWNHESNT